MTNDLIKPLKVMSLVASTDHVYALDEDGSIWWRRKLPSSYSAYTTADKKKAEVAEEEEAAKPWRRINMSGQLMTVKDIPASKDVPPEMSTINPKPERVVTAPFSNPYAVVGEDDFTDGRGVGAISGYENVMGFEE